MTTIVKPNHPLTDAQQVQRRQKFDCAVDEISSDAIAFVVHYYIQKLAKWLQEHDKLGYDAAMLYATAFVSEYVRMSGEEG